MDVMIDKRLEELCKKTIEEMEEVRNNMALTQREKYIRQIELARILGRACLVRMGKIPFSEENE